MSIILEIEKRFLIEFPKSWAALAEILDNLVQINRISQTYLSASNNEPAIRVRKTQSGLSGKQEIIYHFNQKSPVETGVHKEKEYEITKSKYEEYLKDTDPKKIAVNKTRFVFKYKDQLFELDIFKGALTGLAILELELKNKNQKIHLPPFIKVIKDVTSDKKYSNYFLADKHI